MINRNLLMTYGRPSQLCFVRKHVQSRNESYCLMVPRHQSERFKLSSNIAFPNRNLFRFPNCFGSTGHKQFCRVHSAVLRKLWYRLVETTLYDLTSPLCKQILYFAVFYSMPCTTAIHSRADKIWPRPVLKTY